MGCTESSVDEPVSEYDSTWDEESEQHCVMPRVTRQHTWPTHRNLEVARDMQNYRHSCRNLRHVYQPHGHKQHNPNLYFYQNKSPSYPDGVHIDEFHNKWFGDYTRLEKVHSYIQWLFPTLEPGVNHSAYVLTPTEIEHFHTHKDVKERLVKSYKLMLDFYGIQLINEATGEVTHAKNWRERFENLNRNSHNNLRITRILKCLGLLGFGRYQAPLVHFFLEETLVRGTLPRVKQSALDYFIFTVLDKAERKELIRFAFDNFYPKELFVWCPTEIQTLLCKKMTEKQNLLQTDGARRKLRNYQSCYRIQKMNTNNARKKKRAKSAGRSKIDPRTYFPNISRIIPSVGSRVQNQNCVTW